MYAILKTGGKQYRVQEGDVIKVEKLGVQKGDTVELGEVLLLRTDDGVNVGHPVVPGVSVVARVLDQGKSKKILVFKYKPKKNYRRRYGHRQPFSVLKIEKIKTSDSEADKDVVETVPEEAQS
ncbi:MAG TPA: 50S ribosomal protein L21 [Firmicutes bacterium]|nr:50S ribosomal protein L21 [Bacillota bacterium]HHY97237.1 50S ribosomal protein L21 [Bacillota bacterium]